MTKAANDEARILGLLEKSPGGLTLEEILHGLRIERKDRAKTEERLRTLIRRRLVRRAGDRWTLSRISGLVRGRFETSGRGFGFVIPGDGASADVFVPARFASGAMNGDMVEVLAGSGRDGRPEGRVVRIVRKARKRLLGTYGERFGRPFVIPFDAPSAEEIPVVSRGSLFPSAGEIVALDRASGTVAEILGRPEDPGVDIQVMIRKYGLAEAFSDAALAEAEAEAGRDMSEALPGRMDHRGWTSFTIDGESAQDFDDAVSIRRREGGGWTLGVHIADVSHYVRPGSALEAEAAARATSVYFPGLTLPMLPERLSNDLCSLRPRRDRLAVSVIMEFDGAGERIATAFHPAVIRTAERMTYEAVFRILEGDDSERTAFAPIVPDLMDMRDLARVLRKRRLDRGSLDFDIVEPELVYSEGKIVAVAAFEPNEAHKIIEEFMVAANEAVAGKLRRRRVPSLYRVHARPTEPDLENLRETLAPLGILLPEADRIGPGDLQRAIRAAEGTPVEKYVSVRILRSLRLAEYSVEPSGHYGLALEDYAHFTSPIRRYPDLVVHRILKGVAAGGFPQTPELEESARRSSERERQADAAEKDLVEWRIFRFLKERLGDVVSGTVVDVSRSGLVIEIDEVFVPGLLAFDDLGGGPPLRRPGRGSKAKRTAPRYELGSRLEVQIAAVDPILRRLSLVPPRPL